jgi:hypothetical protein
MLNELIIHIAVPFYHSGIFLMIILGGFLFDYFVSCFVFFFFGAIPKIPTIVVDLREKREREETK